MYVQIKLQCIHSMYNVNCNEQEDIWNLLLVTVFTWRKWAVFCKGHWARRNSLVMKVYRSSSEKREVKLLPCYCSANFLVMQETVFVETKQFVAGIQHNSQPQFFPCGHALWKLLSLSCVRKICTRSLWEFKAQTEWHLPNHLLQKLLRQNLKSLSYGLAIKILAPVCWEHMFHVWAEPLLELAGSTCQS